MQGICPPEDRMVHVLKEALRTCRRSGDILTVPNVLVPQDRLPSVADGAQSTPLAQRVLQWLVQMGFCGDRTRMNTHGYPGLFRELTEPPPWVCVEPDDCWGEVGAERAAELAPLYLQCLEHGDALIGRYAQFLEARTREFGEKCGLIANLVDPRVWYELNRSRLADLAQKISLLRLMERERLEALCECVYECEGYVRAAGAPDLFIWHPDPAHDLWLFAEVKGPRDHLRTSQYEWLRGNWEQIEGRAVVMTFLPGTGAVSEYA